MTQERALEHSPESGRPAEPKPAARSMDPLTGAFEHLVQRQHNRRERTVAEILANRRGEYRVPTWVLFLALAAMIGSIVAVLLLA